MTEGGARERRTLGVLLALMAVGMGSATSARALQEPDSVTLVRLEAVWNEAHLNGDTVALDELWADDIRIEVPEMPVMTKSEVLAFWRSGRSNIVRYETSEVEVGVEGDSAIVVGRLLRDRDFNGRSVRDDWRFTKVYRRFDGRWRVTVYRARRSLETLRRTGSSRAMATSGASKRGVESAQEADEGTEGPASIVVVDPDGNPILIDQHCDGRVRRERPTRIDTR